jgi:CSLREA domain-containing protein
MSRTVHSYSGVPRIFSLTLLAGLLVMAAQPASRFDLLTPAAHAAAAFTVNSTGDGADSNTADGVCDDGSGKCTLRAAIQQANATAGADTINFSVTDTIALSGALPDITSGMTITGPGLNRLRVSGNVNLVNAGSVFKVTAESPAVVTIAGLTVSGGHDTNGGGIHNTNSATVNVFDIMFHQNFATVSGGGISNSGSGTVHVANSMFNNNLVQSNGAGIFNSSLGTMTVTNSSVSSNSVFSDSGGGSGGGIDNAGTLTVINCTIAGNATGFGVSGSHDGDGGGINNIGTASIGNTIVAGNSVAANGHGHDLKGTFNSLDYNLIKDTTDATFVGVTTHHITGLDPELSGQVPRLSSPAIDKGKNLATDSQNNPILTDQRGFRRTADLVDSSFPNADGGDGTDIGAVELDYEIHGLDGFGQSTAINTNFPIRLKVRVLFPRFPGRDPGTPAPGAPVTFTAPASGPSGTFQGTGTNTVTVNTDSDGVATAPVFTANGTVGGPYMVVASLGTNSPTAIFDLTNLKAVQTITFGALPNKTFGDTPFTVSATGGASGNPVTFSASGSCSSGGTNGSTININGAGSCTVTASQAGDSTFSAAADVQQSLQIAKAASATSVSSSANPSAVGQGVTFTATVSSTAGTPTGTVAFKDGGTAIPTCGSVALASGQATCTTSALSPGAHTLTADYSGDSNFSPSSGTLSGGQATGSVFEFSQAVYTVAERGGTVAVTVMRTGITAQAAAVDYVTDDGGSPSVFVPCSATTGLASERCDYTRAAGTLSFAANETQKTFAVLVNDDSYVEGAETLTLRLSNPDGGSGFGPQSVSILRITDDATESAGNPIDDPATFVRQHYHDFLNREPDAPGLAFWTDQVTNCGNPNPAVCRDNVSAAFFLSIEFQQTGYLVEKMYKAAYGDATGSSTPGLPNVPVVRFAEFLHDTQEIGSTPNRVIVEQGDWRQQLEENKNAFALEFVKRERFAVAFPASMTADTFVRRLDMNTGGVLTSAEIAQLDAVFGGPLASTNDAPKRAQVLRQVAENTVLQQREFNRAFVLMQYYGYLRRNPDDAPEPNLNFAGWRFWLDKLNENNGNFVQAEMVKAFLFSDEYRRRFGQ